MKTSKAVQAAREMDWEQVRLNGGPPCFHIDVNDGYFCGRAERWHEKGTHKYVSLAELIESLDPFIQ